MAKNLKRSNLEEAEGVAGCVCVCVVVIGSGRGICLWHGLSQGPETGTGRARVELEL